MVAMSRAGGFIPSSGTGGAVATFVEPWWQLKHSTLFPPLKLSALIFNTIDIIVRAVFLASFSSLERSSTWQYSQSAPSALRMYCIAGFKSAAGISFKTVTFL